MDISYKFYVHVFDAESGELAAQLDTVPRDWSYPTNVWDARGICQRPPLLASLQPATGHLPRGGWRLPP